MLLAIENYKCPHCGGEIVHRRGRIGINHLDGCPQLELLLGKYPILMDRIARERLLVA